MPAGKLAGQPIRNTNVSGRVNRGLLELSPLIATAALADDNSAAPNQLHAQIAWPLGIDQNTAPGTAILSGQSLPTPWVVGVIQNQIFNATGKHLVEESSKLAQRIAAMGGDVNFNTQINIHSHKADRWLVT